MKQCQKASCQPTSDDADSENSYLNGVAIWSRIIIRKLNVNLPVAMWQGSISGSAKYRSKETIRKSNADLENSYLNGVAIWSRIIIRKLNVNLPVAMRQGSISGSTKYRSKEAIRK